MSHELGLNIPHKAAARLAQILGMGMHLIDDPKEKLFFRSLLTQVQNFAESRPPIQVKVTVVARDGIPVDEP